MPKIIGFSASLAILHIVFHSQAHKLRKIKAQLFLYPLALFKRGFLAHAENGIYVNTYHLRIS